MSMQQLDIKDFRRALSQFPTGVTVITTRDSAGEPVGVTASSFNSVSIDPPLVLWSVDKSAYSARVFEEAEYFIVNVLGRNQVATSNTFASRGEDKFANAEYHAGLGGCPVLDHCAAQFECKTWSVYEGGDHLIIVGEVQEYRHEDSIEPLVFARGGYAISAQHPQMSSQASATERADANDFIGDYLLYLLRESYQRFSGKLYPKLKAECSVTPEEWRILARMVDYPSIAIDELSIMVMQPERSLRETADWMVDKGQLTYADTNTLTITEQGAALARKVQAVALDEEATLLSQLNSEEARTLKDNLKALMNRLG